MCFHLSRWSAPVLFLTSFSEANTVVFRSFLVLTLYLTSKHIWHIWQPSPDFWHTWWNTQNNVWYLLKRLFSVHTKYFLCFYTCILAKSFFGCQSKVSRCRTGIMCWTSSCAPCPRTRASLLAALAAGLSLQEQKRNAVRSGFERSSWSEAHLAR